MDMLRAVGLSVVLAWAGAHFVSYCVLGVSAYSWYYDPLIPGFIAALGLGVGVLFRVRVLQRTLDRTKAHSLMTIGSICLLATLTLGQLLQVSKLRPDTRFAVASAACRRSSPGSSPAAPLVNSKVRRSARSSYGRSRLRLRHGFDRTPPSTTPARR